MSHATFLLEALHDLETALAGDLRDESRVLFDGYRSYIRRVFENANYQTEDRSYPGISYKTLPPEIVQQVKFYLDNDLFLNVCGACRKCDNAIGDKASLDSFVVTAKAMFFPELSTDEQFYRVAHRLNKIKLDYATARHLLAVSVLGTQPSTEFDGLVSYQAIPLPFSKSASDNLLQFAYRALYDLLDKISVLLNEYLNLGIPEEYARFVWLWYRTTNRDDRSIRQAILDTENENLNALFHLAVELDKETGNCCELTRLRHRMTHGLPHHLLTPDGVDAPC